MHRWRNQRCETVARDRSGAVTAVIGREMIALRPLRWVARFMTFLLFAALPFVGAIVVIVVVACFRSGQPSPPQGCRWCSQYCCGRRPDRWGRAITVAVGRRILAPALPGSVAGLSFGAVSQSPLQPCILAEQDCG